MLAWPALIGASLPLRDAEHRCLGTMTLERVEDDLLYGSFVRGTDFAAVEPLFHDLQEVADHQILSLLDQVTTAIEALGVHLELRDGVTVPVSDLQIWDDGAMSCRPRSAPVASANGAATTGAQSLANP